VLLRNVITIFVAFLHFSSEVCVCARMKGERNGFLGSYGIDDAQSGAWYMPLNVLQA